MFKINKLFILLMMYTFGMGLHAASDLQHNAVGDMAIQWEDAKRLWSEAKDMITNAKSDEQFSEKAANKQKARELMLQSLKLLPIYLKNDSYFNRSISYSANQIDFKRIIIAKDFLYLGTGFGASELRESIYGKNTTDYIKSKEDIIISPDEIIDALFDLKDFNNQAIIIKLKDSVGELSLGDQLLSFVYVPGLPGIFSVIVNLFIKARDAKSYTIELGPNIEIIVQNMPLNNLFMRADDKSLNEMIPLLFNRVNLRGQDVAKTIAGYISPESQAAGISRTLACYILALPKDKAHFSNNEIALIVENYTKMLRELLTAFNTDKLKSIAINIEKMISIIENAGSVLLENKQ